MENTGLRRLICFKSSGRRSHNIKLDEYLSTTELLALQKPKPNSKVSTIYNLESTYKKEKKSKKKIQV